MLKGAFKKWGFGKSKKEEPSLRPKRHDDVHVKIYQLSGKKEKIELASGEGNWLSHLMFGNKTYWRVEDLIP